MVNVGHTTSVIMCQGLHQEHQYGTDVIIDNTLFGCHTIEQANDIAQAYSTRCAKYQATLGELSNSSDEVTYRGIVINTKYKTWCLSPRFVQRAVARIGIVLDTQSATNQQIESVLGTIVYARIVLNKKSVDFFHIAKLVARNQHQAPKSQGEKYTLTPSVVKELTLTQNWIATNQPWNVSIQNAASDATFVIIADAAKNGPFGSWGSIIATPTQGKIRTFSDRFPITTAINASINELELRAVMETVSRFTFPKCCTIQVMTDNEACRFVLSKGSSTSIVLNQLTKNFWMIAEANAWNVSIHRVSTDDNPADGLSRGRSWTEEDQHKLDKQMRELGYGGGEGRGCSPTVTLTNKEHLEFAMK